MVRYIRETPHPSGHVEPVVQEPMHLSALSGSMQSLGFRV